MMQHVKISLFELDAFWKTEAGGGRSADGERCRRSA